MSVNGLVKDREVQDLFEPLLPATRKLGLRLKAPPHRNSGPLVGTAFDYAVRFELQRRHPHARAERWVAERAVDEVEPIAGIGSFERLDENGEVFSFVDGDLAARWVAVVREARAAVASYVADPKPTIAARKNIARHALRLARLDPFIRTRGRHAEPEPEKVERTDLADVLDLLSMVPWDEVGSSRVLWLNPTFGAQSVRVGGADADLISGDHLLDLKVVTSPTTRADLRQLLAYLILARAAHAADPSFPTVTSVGVYYARQGRLWLLPASVFANHPAFADVEKRFFERADELYKRSEGDLETENDW